MNSDKFESTKFQEHELNIGLDNNFSFFLPSDNISIPVVPSEVPRHLNDYDLNILKEGAYRDMPDEAFRLEYKISHLEDEIKEIDKQIELALEIDAISSVRNLQIIKQQKEIELKDYINIYNNASISAKISGNLNSKIKDSFITLLNKLVKCSVSLLSRLPRVSSFIKIKNSLNKLEHINKSVDALMSIQYPYGETIERYEQLTKYIARANAIQSEISKHIS